MPTKGFVILTLLFRQEGKRWTGECLELGTATYGRTLKQVQAELAELVTLHLSSLEDAGEREHFFRRHNIRLYTDDALPTEVTPPPIPVDGESYFQARRVPIGARA